MKDRLNVGVIGAGWWATSAHIPAIVNNDKANLLAVQNRTIAKAEKIAHDFGAEAAFDSYRDLVKMDQLDAVVVSSTPNVHYEQAKYALEHGKHVLLEKPMTIKAGQAEELCRIAEKNHLQLSVSCPWHFTRHGLKAQKLIKEGQLGKVKMISILMTNPVDKLLKGINTSPTHGLNDVYIEPNQGSYSDPKIAGGGQIYSQVSHAGAYLSFLTGAKPVEVFAQFDFAGSVNDIYNALTIKMTDGILVNLASTGATPLELRNYEVRIFGTKGVLLLELWQGQMAFHPFESEAIKYSDLAMEDTYPDRAPLTNFVGAVLKSEQNISPGILGWSAMEIIEAACHSDECGKPVIIR